MSEPVRFEVDGQPAAAEAGTSLLAALWNAGSRAVRTSVGGEARGPLCAMGTCFECRVDVDGAPHVRSCLTPVREGMRVSLRSALRPDAAPGGPGPARAEADRMVEAEVVVVGAGPAGIAAAIHAAEADARTLLVDAYARAGGQIWRHRGQPAAAARGWLDRLGRAGVEHVLGAAAVDAAGGELLLDEGGGATRVRYGRLVLATGARELFLPFPGWTLPGVLGVGGAQALLKAGASFSSRRVLVAGSGPLLPAVAAALAGAGARIVGVVEQAPLDRLTGFAFGLWRAPHKLAEGAGYLARLASVPYRWDSILSAVEPHADGLRATIQGRYESQVECDVVACGYGLIPNLELPRLLGCDVVGGRVVTDAEQRTSVEGVYAAGELGGIAGVEHALVTGQIAGLAAAGRVVPAPLLRRATKQRAFGERLAQAFELRGELRHLAELDTIACRCEDVALVAVARCAGSTSSRDVKLATRVGMGPCQGRVCGPALEFLRGFPLDSVRPPVLSAPIGVLMQAPELPEEQPAAPART
jgi:NADPH-dependent 2,4-dienoyl-CoA reductase/sulfur reductase-like enzyme